MNMLLLKAGYPPAIIRKRNRLAYIESLEKAQTGGSQNDYLKLIADAVSRSLDIYLKAVRNEEAEPEPEEEALLKIGQLARLVGKNNSTIRYWTKNGLLSVAATTEAGYQLYAPESVDRAKQIMELQNRRLTLEEIRQEFE